MQLSQLKFYFYFDKNKIAELKLINSLKKNNRK